LFCGECYWCRRGDRQLCKDLASLGLMGDGGLAEQMLAPAAMCIPYSSALTAEEAVLAEPLSVAVRAVRRSGLRPGANVGIVGAGTIGLLALQVARAAGAATVTVVERHERRRTMALELGATAAFGPDCARKGALETTEGVGFDVTIEVAGRPDASVLAIELTRRGGRTVLLGVYKGTIAVPALDFLMSEREIVSSMSHVCETDFVEAVSLLDTGLVKVDQLISHRIALSDIVAAGFERLLHEPDECLKIVVLPTSRSAQLPAVAQ
jgi:(R,R)-butanediol dehydrogenase/meso-butanediol dehydrogenase/diacetyl reductase